MRDVPNLFRTLGQTNRLLCGEGRRLTCRLRDTVGIYMEALNGSNVQVMGPPVWREAGICFQVQLDPHTY